VAGAKLSQGYSQDVTRDWRCKCGALNKAGSFMCLRRGCHIYFCLGCGALGHQQRFCRQTVSQGPPAMPLTPFAAEQQSLRRAKDAPAQSLTGVAESSWMAGVDESTSECVVCMDAPAHVTFYPCGHCITCGSCTRALQAHGKGCPFCSKEIQFTDLANQPGPWNLA